MENNKLEPDDMTLLMLIALLQTAAVSMPAHLTLKFLDLVWTALSLLPPMPSMSQIGEQQLQISSLEDRILLTV